MTTNFQGEESNPFITPSQMTATVHQEFFISLVMRKMYWFNQVHKDLILSYFPGLCNNKLYTRVHAYSFYIRISTNLIYK